MITKVVGSSSILERERLFGLGRTRCRLVLFLRRLRRDGRSKDPEGDFEVLVEGRRRRRVVELGRVVRAREERDEPAVGEELVAVLDDLVRADHQVDVERSARLRHDVLPEGVRAAT